MKHKSTRVLFALIGLFVSAFLGVVCASLISVVSKESMMAKQLSAMAVKILHAVHVSEKVPTSIDDLVGLGVFSKEDVIDVWGGRIELQRPSEDEVLLISRGDPAVSRMSPGILSTISCRIPVSSKTRESQRLIDQCVP